MRRHSMLFASFLIATAGLPALGQSAAASSTTDVQAALKTPIDARHAKVGEEVSAVTRNDASLSGTRLPKGSLLVGHITDVAAKSGSSANSSVSMLFDQARLKDGTTVPLHATLRSLAPAAHMQADADDDAGFGAGPASGGMSARTSASPRTPSAGGLIGGATSATRGAIGGVTDTASTVTRSAASDVGRATDATANAAMRGVSSLPGVSVSTAADASTSGTVAAQGRNLHLDSGTQLTLGLSTR